MSHINFDFLTESFLFGYGLEDNFSALSDYELEKELNRYRAVSYTHLTLPTT